MFIRPVTHADHEAILSLARQAGFGMTSLPPDETVLREKIEKAVQSFAASGERQGEESFLFVLVDPDSDEVVGTCGIKAHVGTTQPFYSYKLSTISKFCQSLNIITHQKLLHVVNDYNGTSEIGSLFLAPEYRRDRIGRFLSRMRFLFIAEFRPLFDERVISEIRGTHDHEGHSPFYDGIARHFFQMDFAQADYINATQGNQFISDLMPKYPIYVNLLPKPAQETIGRPHPSSEAAKAMLEREGFRYSQYLDVFDGGPTLEVFTDSIRTVRESQHAVVAELVDGLPPATEKYMVCNRSMAEHRAALGPVALRQPGGHEEAILSRSMADMLMVSVGDTIRLAKA